MANTEFENFIKGIYTIYIVGINMGSIKNYKYGYSADTSMLICCLIANNNLFFITAYRLQTIYVRTTVVKPSLQFDNDPRETIRYRYFIKTIYKSHFYK